MTLQDAAATLHGVYALLEVGDLLTLTTVNSRWASLIYTMPRGVAVRIHHEHATRIEQLKASPLGSVIDHINTDSLEALVQIRSCLPHVTSLECVIDLIESNTPPPSIFSTQLLALDIYFNLSNSSEWQQSAHWDDVKVVIESISECTALTSLEMSFGMTNRFTGPPFAMDVSVMQSMSKLVNLETLGVRCTIDGDVSDMGWEAEHYAIIRSLPSLTGCDFLDGLFELSDLRFMLGGVTPEQPQRLQQLQLRLTTLTSDGNDTDADSDDDMSDDSSPASASTPVEYTMSSLLMRLTHLTDIDIEMHSTVDASFLLAFTQLHRLTIGISLRLKYDPYTVTLESILHRFTELRLLSVTVHRVHEKYEFTNRRRMSPMEERVSSAKGKAFCLESLRAYEDDDFGITSPCLEEALPKMPHLTSLTLNNARRLRSLDFVQSSLPPTLKELSLSSAQLRAIDMLSFKVGSCPSLRSLTLDHCFRDGDDLDSFTFSVHDPQGAHFAMVAHKFPRLEVFKSEHASKFASHGGWTNYQ